MKKIAFLLLAVLVLAMLPTSCGKDGLPGSAYIRIIWSSLPDWYNDDNSDTPFTVTYGVSYETDPGTYDFDYQVSGAWWEGWYEIEINPGEEGGLIADGKDGLDRNYTLGLYASGPTFTYTNGSAIEKHQDIVEQSGADQDNEFEVKGNPSTPDHILDDEVFFKEITKGRVTLRIQYQRVHPK